MNACCLLRNWIEDSYMRKYSGNLIDLFIPRELAVRSPNYRFMRKQENDL